MVDQPPFNLMAFIEAVLTKGRSKSLLDVGCGAGRIRPRIEAMGVKWQGVDPAPPPNIKGILRAGAEALPFMDGAFDAVLFLNALHHVPIPLMQTALHEALRVLAVNAAPVIIIEPATEGDLSEVLRPIDDETEVRTAAQAAIKALVTNKTATLIEKRSYTRNEHYVDFDDLAAKLTAADSMRIAPLHANRKAMSDNFHRLAQKRDGGYILRQPMSVCLLSHAGPRG